MPRTDPGPSLFDLIREPETIPGTQCPELTPVNSGYSDDDDDPDAPLSEGCRIIYRDRDGRDWPGLHRFTLGTLASVTLDEPGLSGSGVRKFRIDPSTLRREPRGGRP